jgi:ribosomal protein S18 acetylase RimI-like enzyme
LEKEIIGYLKINFGKAQTELMDSNAAEIERIYVLKQFQGKKVGHLLLEKAMGIAHKMKVKYLWLGVWEKNIGAIGFYRKHGFKEYDKHIFKLGDDNQTDILMKVELT